MKTAVKEAKSTIQKIQGDIAQYYNQRKTPTPIFCSRDQVFLDTLDIKTIRLSTKLLHRRLRPYQVERQVGPIAYRLKLSPAMKKLHPVFNIVKLSTAPTDLIPDRKPKPPLSPIIIDREKEQEVEEILDSCWYWRRFQFLVKQKGYSWKHNSWKSISNVSVSNLIVDFYCKYPATLRYIH